LKVLLTFEVFQKSPPKRRHAATNGRELREEVWNETSKQLYVIVKQSMSALIGGSWSVGGTNWRINEKVNEKL